MEVKRNMNNLDGTVCPWIGCGGTIVRQNKSNPEYTQEWVCSICGELFSSPEDYESKLHKENDWAEAWIKWGEEKKQTDLEKPEEIEEVIVEADELEEVGAEEELAAEAV